MIFNLGAENPFIRTHQELRYSCVNGPAHVCYVFLIIIAIDKPVEPPMRYLHTAVRDVGLEYPIANLSR